MENAAGTLGALRADVVESEANLLAALLTSARGHPHRLALRDSGSRTELTWSGYAERVAVLAAGLAGLGCGRGDRIALLVSNRPEWQISDMAALAVGAVPFSLYTNVPAAHMLEHLTQSGARLLVAEEGLLQRSGLTTFAEVEDIVVIGAGSPAPAPGPPRHDWSELGRSAPPVDLADLERRISPDDVATLIFTSGTTGRAKQVRLSHRNAVAVASAMAATAGLARPDAGRLVSYLPHAHVVDRLVGHYVPTVTAATVTTVADARTVFDHLPAIRPTLFTSVPRLWERLRAQLESRIDDDPAGLRAAYDRSRANLTEVRARAPRATSAVAPPSSDAAAWRALRHEIGLGDSTWTITGSAPLSQGTHDFFEAIGLPLHDCWGLSESTSLATVNVPGHRLIGTVGRALPGTELRIADDGEVLLRGFNVMLGYRDDPDADARAFTPDGWFRTGDLGELDDGYLRLIGRKKEILVTEGGENVAPVRVEAALVDSSPLISQACVVGDARPSLAALLVVDGPAAQRYAADELADAVSEAVGRVNEKLTRPERIRRYTLVTAPFTFETGELTPTLKLRRDAVTEKYADLIESLYDGTGGGHDVSHHAPGN